MDSKYVSFRVNYVDFYGKKMKSLAYSESTRRKRGLERGDFALVVLSLQHSKDKHVGRVHAQTEILAMCSRVKMRLEI